MIGKNRRAAVSMLYLFSLIYSFFFFLDLSLLYYLLPLSVLSFPLVSLPPSSHLWFSIYDISIGSFTTVSLVCVFFCFPYFICYPPALLVVLSWYIPYNHVEEGILYSHQCNRRRRRKYVTIAKAKDMSFVNYHVEPT